MDSYVITISSTIVSPIVLGLCSKKEKKPIKNVFTPNNVRSPLVRRGNYGDLNHLEQKLSYAVLLVIYLLEQKSIRLAFFFYIFFFLQSTLNSFELKSLEIDQLGLF